MKRLLLLLLFPALAYTQEVSPVLSKDYLALINADTLRVKPFLPDTLNSIKLSPLVIHQHYYGFKVRAITIKNGVLDIYSGADPNQLLYDQPNAAGLDLFNLPSVKTFGCNISIQF